MTIDIIIFAGIALMLILKLKSVLGTGSDNGSSKDNPFANADNVIKIKEPIELKPATLEEMTKNIPLIIDNELIDEKSNEEHIIEEGLKEIFESDRNFDLKIFVEGSKYAFNMIVKSYDESDTANLKPLMSEKLYSDFVNALNEVKKQEIKTETIIHDIKDTKIIEAHLGGLMAYITIKYLVEQTSCVRNKDNVVIEGDPDNITTVENIWTFTRDMRTDDPNWTLIKTRTTEQE